MDISQTLNRLISWDDSWEIDIILYHHLPLRCVLHAVFISCKMSTGLQARECWIDRSTVNHCRTTIWKGEWRGSHVYLCLVIIYQILEGWRSPLNLQHLDLIDITILTLLEPFFTKLMSLHRRLLYMHPSRINKKF